MFRHGRGLWYIYLLRSVWGFLINVDVGSLNIDQNIGWKYQRLNHMENIIRLQFADTW